MSEPQPASEADESFAAACRRVAAALRRNARAAPDAATQRLALERADELEARALRGLQRLLLEREIAVGAELQLLRVRLAVRTQGVLVEEEHIRFHA